MQSVLKNLDSRLAMCLDLDGSTRPLSRGLAGNYPTTTPLKRHVFGSSPASYVTQDNQYHVVYHESAKEFVDSLVRESNKQEHNISLKSYETNWGTFNDGSDDIKILGMTSPTFFKGKNVMFVASFHNNSVMMSQFHVIAYLCECLVGSLTVLLPYYPTGTMERVDIGSDGVIPTANTLALLFNGLPSVGRPIRVMTYDLHTLQNRFYFGGHAVATLHTAIPLILSKIDELKGGGKEEITAVAFPDEGACKRFGTLFKDVFKGDDIIICSKVRSGDTKVVTISDGEPHGKHVVIIDDQTKSGGTLIDCAKKLKERGASLVSAYVTHAICTDEFWSKFLPESKTNTESAEGQKAPIDIFHKVYCSDSFPVLLKELEIVKGGKDLNFKIKDGKGIPTSTTLSTSEFKGQPIWDKLEILSLADLVLTDL